MKAFRKVYLWALYAKLYMGIYFVALVVLTGFMQYIYGQTTIEFTILLQMLGVSVALSVGQAILVNEDMDFSSGIFFTRSILWLVLSDALIVAGAFLGGWLEGLPSISIAVLGVLMLLGLGATLVGLKWDQDRETIRLNTALTEKKAQMMDN